MKKMIATLGAAVLLMSAGMSRAGTAPSYPEQAWDEAKYVLSSPARWEGDEWKKAGWAGLAVLEVAMVADRPVRDFMRQQPRGNSFINTVENFGTTYAFGTMGAFYLIGTLTDNAQSVQVAQDAVTASLISAGINQTVKIAANRSRPREDAGLANFQGYSGLNNNSSFPSGHTTEAFTLAAVIANSYDDAWVGYAAYSVAGLVGVARMYNDAHFASDVTASAILGIYVGKSVVQRGRHLRQHDVIVLPELLPDGGAIRVVSLF